MMHSFQLLEEKAIAIFQLIKLRIDKKDAIMVGAKSQEMRVWEGVTKNENFLFSRFSVLELCRNRTTLTITCFRNYNSPPKTQQRTHLNPFLTIIRFFGLLWKL
jgi:hypothetical protein